MNDLRRSLLEAIRLMAKRNDVIQDTHGNVSVRDGESFMWIKPSGVPYEKIEFDNLCGIDFYGTGGHWLQVAGNMRPSVDTVHHRWIYQRNPKVKAIVHTHSPYVVAHAIRGSPILCVTTEQADYFGDDVRCLPYADLDKWGDLFFIDEPKAVLLQSHGALTFADDPVKAVNLAIQLENIARKNILAGVIEDRKENPLTRDERQKWHRRYQDVYGQR